MAIDEAKIELVYRNTIVLHVKQIFNTFSLAHYYKKRIFHPKAANIFMITGSWW